jgi:hypothetical protein
MSGFLEIKRTMGCKIEGTPYVQETLAATDYNVAAYNINYDPEVAMYARRLARGDASNDLQIPGTQKIKITFEVDVCVGTNVYTPPNYWKCLRACGLKQTIYNTTGCALIPHSGYFNVPMTIEVVEMDEGISPLQVVVAARGCMGTAKFVGGGVGLPKKIQFDFTGVLVSVNERSFANQIMPTGWDAALPQAVLACTTSLYGVSQMFDKLTLDVGNKLEVWKDPTKGQGFEGTRIIDRTPTLELDPALRPVSTQDMYSNLMGIGSSPGAYSETIGSSTTGIPLTITAPKCQVIQSNKPGKREGRVTNEVKCLLSRNLGNDEFMILQGAIS